MLTHRDIMRRNAECFPANVAISSWDVGDLTYRDLDAVTDCFAARLQAMGVRAGHRAFWLDHNSGKYLVAYYGTAKAGVAFSPANYWLRERELSAQVALVQPAIVFAGHGFHDRVEANR